MRQARVLVVDDAVVVRRLVSEVVSADPELQVVATAPNGRIGLAKIAQVNPDLVVLDVEMPEMDGLETLTEIRRTHPRLPVLMFSTLTERGAAATLDALARGASDYVTKPSKTASLAEALAQTRQELLPKIKSLCPFLRSPLPALHLLTPSSVATKARSSPRSGRVDAVVVGVSTGGPNALATVVPALPGDIGVPILIVQHMPPVFTRLLAERLSAKSELLVREAVEGGPISAGEAWVARGGYHLVVERNRGSLRVDLDEGPPENSCRPAADVLFRSAVEAYGGNLLAVVLTGMGQDGLRGCERVREAGGQVIVQDKPTSVVWGMPGFVANAGLADGVLPLHQIAPEIVRRVQAGNPTRLVRP